MNQLAIQDDDRQIDMPDNTAPVHPMMLIQQAVAAGQDIEYIKQLMDLKKDYENEEARKAFIKALSLFKSNPPSIKKDKHVRFKTDKGVTSYYHASIGAVCEAIAKGLGEYGLSHRWHTQQLEQGRIRVTCILSHELGHSEETSLEGSPDASGGKNAIQATGSTVTYLERYTLLAATGIATHDQDDDGAGANKTLSKEQVNTINALLKKARVSAKKVIETVNSRFGTDATTISDLHPRSYEFVVSKLELAVKNAAITGNKSTDDPPVMDSAGIMSAMKKAKNLDDLKAAYDFVRSIDSEESRKVLSKYYRTREAVFLAKAGVEE